MAAGRVGPNGNFVANLWYQFQQLFIPQCKRLMETLLIFIKFKYYPHTQITGDLIKIYFSHTDITEPLEALWYGNLRGIYMHRTYVNEIFACLILTGCIEMKCSIPEHGHRQL